MSKITLADLDAAEAITIEDLDALETLKQAQQGMSFGRNVIHFIVKALSYIAYCTATMTFLIVWATQDGRGVAVWFLPVIAAVAVFLHTLANRIQYLQWFTPNLWEIFEIFETEDNEGWDADDWAEFDDFCEAMGDDFDPDYVDPEDEYEPTWEDNARLGASIFSAIGIIVAVLILLVAMVGIIAIPIVDSAMVPNVAGVAFFAVVLLVTGAGMYAKEVDRNEIKKRILRGLLGSLLLGGVGFGGIQLINIVGAALGY